MSWKAFAGAEPELAAAGERLLTGSDGVAIGFLATVSKAGEARMAPVCPIFCDGEVYLSVGEHTPKVHHLRENGSYALHAFLGEQDEEFQVSGHAVLTTDEEERRRVHEAIRFPSYNAGDPVFRLEVERCFWAKWDGPAERPRWTRRWRSPQAR